MRSFILFFFLFFTFPGFTIYNLKTNTGGLPKKADQKHWLLVSQGCHSCSKVLTKLKTFCSGKKPSPSRIGFFAIGNSSTALLKKLDEFKTNYEIFSGSQNEFYETYKLMGTPSLKTKASANTILGNKKILKFLKKDPTFCSA